jgi:hypothetical protein
MTLKIPSEVILILSSAVRLTLHELLKVATELSASLRVPGA